MLILPGTIHIAVKLIQKLNIAWMLFRLFLLLLFCSFSHFYNPWQVGSAIKDGSREVTELHLCPNPCFCCSIRNRTENNIIENLAGGDFVWIGLHREKQWSDRSPSLFRYWASEQPDSGLHECVTMSFNDSGRWSDDICSLQVPFICYKPSNAYKPCVINYTTVWFNITILII